MPGITSWARNVKRRLAEHEAGRGARLLAVVRDAGIGWQLARMWPGGRAGNGRSNARAATPANARYAA
jgi:hypothetical protein